MIAFKSCPRCRGDLLVGFEDITCIQCGHELRPAEKQAFRERLDAMRAKRMPVAA
jgi:hypothetical protein